MYYDRRVQRKFRGVADDTATSFDGIGNPTLSKVMHLLIDARVIIISL